MQDAYFGTCLVDIMATILCVADFGRKLYLSSAEQQNIGTIDIINDQL